MTPYRERKIIGRARLFFRRLFPRLGKIGIERLCLLALCCIQDPDQFK